MLMLDYAMKSPCQEYRDLLREAIRRTGKTQSDIALEVGLEAANLSNLLAGRRQPLLDYAKNLSLAQACGEGATLAESLQLAAEVCHGINRQPLDFRRYMALAVRTLEKLFNKMAIEIEALQDSYRHGDITEASFIPESLLAAKKVVNSMRYWWPVEEYERWDDYKVIAERFRKRLSELTPEEQVSTLVQWEIEEALEWVREGGDIDPEVEKKELIRRLASALGLKEDGLSQILRGAEQIAGRNIVGTKPRKPSPVKIFSLEDKL